MMTARLICLNIDQSLLASQASELLNKQGGVRHESVMSIRCLA